MSLNWREIAAVLSEWDLKDCRLRKIRQPDYSRLILEFSRQGYGSVIEIVLKAPYVRIHIIGDEKRLPKALPKPPRFTAVLKSRLEGARLKTVFQMGRDRIVRFTFVSAGEEIHLDAKLWGNGANLILVDTNGLIIDAFSRRPKRRESPGEFWPPAGIDPKPEQLEESGQDTSREDTSGRGDDFPLRNLPGTGTWNSGIEHWYRRLENTDKSEKRLKEWRSYLGEKDAVLTRRKSRLEENRRRFEIRRQDGHWGDLIMANLHKLRKGDTLLECEDWEQADSTVRIPLKATLSPLENAEARYLSQKRAERGLKRLSEDLTALEHSRKEMADLLKRLEAGETEEAPFNAEPPRITQAARGKSETPPGLWIRKKSFIIAVGRNARESDWLLRHWAKGNDTWLHVRDWPGGHVFIRGPRGKTIPLELLLDGGNLALSYSQRKKVQEANLYYTQVKNLRRPRNGPVGTVLPTGEKNLRISLDESRLEALKDLIGVD